MYLNIKESQTIEFKQIFKGEYLKTICAFANSNGGSLYVGVDDDSSVVGLENSKELLEKLPNKINNKLGLRATLSTEVPIEKFKENHISKPFNPLIANIFYKAGFVESWGKGTNNMVNDCLKMNMIEPSYEYTFQALKVTFFKTPQKSTRFSIVDMMRENPGVTIAEISKTLNIGRDTINEHISRLKKEDILKRVGGRKDGIWKIDTLKDDFNKSKYKTKKGER